ncbi:uncharacterized protein BJ171DRAFT_509765 [Polychytrium aggregatum]|uniref:uncharacterized protein n=1 Tax=Polychytrium aggregatum TaxID=110093 RepID=UPI0022FEF0A7|nr:uncharacterized protein BJ171DRAFT_509765 [Polychytrium aggregatum]KAI9203496.1 hypothetical protein BJ171DRAFT_509765 [Polychytrium aggregatum]
MFFVGYLLLALLAPLARPVHAASSSWTSSVFQVQSAGSLNSSPFSTITSMGVENNFLMVLGPINPTADVQAATGAKSQVFDQVWQARTNTTSAWLWAWSFSNGTVANSSAVYTALSVKKSSLQIAPNVLILANKSNQTIDVLFYWWLNPRTTSDWAAPAFKVAYPSGVADITKMSSLDNQGGVYAVSASNGLYWTPVLQPLTTQPPSNNQSMLVRQFNGTVQSIWMMQDFSTMFVLEKNLPLAYTLWRWSISGPRQLPDSKGTVVAKLSAANETHVMTSLAVSPNTGNIFVGITNQTIAVLSNTGAPLGSIGTSFVNITSLELNEYTSLLYIGGTSGSVSQIDYFDTSAIAGPPISAAAGSLSAPGTWTVMTALFCALAALHATM